MVNTKKRDILEQYRILLENNLVLTDNLLQWFIDRKVLSNFVVDDIKTLSTSLEKNKKFLQSIMDDAESVFNKVIEGFTLNGQPFLGELLESEDKKASEVAAGASERVIIDDEMLRKCPGIGRLPSDTRDKLKIYLQTQLLRVLTTDAWKAQCQGRSVEIINLKRQHYEAQQKLMTTVEEEKCNVISLKDSLRNEQITRQQKEEELNKVRNELSRLRSDFECKWSNQIKMVDANHRSLFKMSDKMGIMINFLGTLDTLLKINISQTSTQFDSVEQLENKLKRYTQEIESLQNRGIGTDKLKEDLYESLYTSRFIPIEDRKNKPFYDLLVHLYGLNQVKELSNICTNDVLQSKLEREQTNEIRTRDIKIDQLNRLNQDLQAEIERLKASSPISSEQSTAKSTKQQYRPVPSSITVTTREKPKPRQTLKPISVQFGTKPGGN